MSESPNGPTAQLSERELEIIRLVADGLSNKEIASRLFLSVNTVKVHLRNIFSRIGVQSRTEATMYAIAQGWISVPEAPGGAAGPAEKAEPLVTLPPLPWPKRIALAAIVLATALGLLLTWPRSTPTRLAGPSGLVEQQGGAAASDSAAQSGWQTRAQMPTARGRFGLAAARGRLYAIGGFTLTGVTGAVEAYDPQKNVWSTAAAMPLPLGNIAAASLAQRIYVPGGCDAAGVPAQIVQVYDPVSDEWSSDVAPLPAPTCAYALVEYAHKLYLFGGSNGQGYLSASFVYDPQTNRWTALAPMPTERGFAGAAVLRDAIYVVGGYDGQQDLAVCERYRPAADQWDACAPLSVGRGGLGLVTLADQLYAIGGGWNGYLAFGERYNPERNAWSDIGTPLIGQWRNLAAATTDLSQEIYAVGGWNGQTYLSDHLVYDPYPVKLFVPFQSRSGQ